MKPGKISWNYTKSSVPLIGFESIFISNLVGGPNLIQGFKLNTLYGKYSELEAKFNDFKAYAMSKSIQVPEQMK